MAKTLYVKQNTMASRDVAQLRKEGRNADADLINARIALKPSCRWLGSWSADPAKEIRDEMAECGAQQVVFVGYNVFRKDCGSYSAVKPGAKDHPAYLRWIEVQAEAFKLNPNPKNKPMYILEPDGLGVIDCLDRDGFIARLTTLRRAVDILRLSGVDVYIDVPIWIDVEDALDRLYLAGVRNAAGFAMNVAISNSTEECVAYANKLRADSRVGNKSFVIDTSRNGAADAGGDWCNPKNVRLGASPTMSTGIVGCKAKLYVKTVGGSDGSCGRGEPEAGSWFRDYALRLAGKYDS